MIRFASIGIVSHKGTKEDTKLSKSFFAPLCLPLCLCVKPNRRNFSTSATPHPDSSQDETAPHKYSHQPPPTRTVAHTPSHPPPFRPAPRNKTNARSNKTLRSRSPQTTHAVVS